MMWFYGMSLSDVDSLNQQARRHLACLLRSAWYSTFHKVTRIAIGTHSACVNLSNLLMGANETDVGGKLVFGGNSLLLADTNMDPRKSKLSVKEFIESENCQAYGQCMLLDQLEASGDTRLTMSDIVSEGRTADLLTCDTASFVEMCEAALDQFVSDLSIPGTSIGVSHDVCWIHVLSVCDFIQRTLPSNMMFLSTSIRPFRNLY